MRLAAWADLIHSLFALVPILAQRLRTLYWSVKNSFNSIMRSFRNKENISICAGHRRPILEIKSSLLYDGIRLSHHVWIRIVKHSSSCWENFKHSFARTRNRTQVRYHDSVPDLLVVGLSWVGWRVVISYLILPSIIWKYRGPCRFNLQKILHFVIGHSYAN